MTATSFLPEQQATHQYRVLVVDDNEDIHHSMDTILTKSFDTKDATDHLNQLGSELFASEPQPTPTHDTLTAQMNAMSYTIDHTLNGEHGLEKVQQAQANDFPYTLAIIDGRMPNGWDGVTTIKKIWDIDPTIQIIFCSAYNDYSHTDMVKSLGATDSLLILRKPFDPVELQQMCLALSNKWRLSRLAQYIEQQHKLDSLGEMASHLGHDLSNILSAILGHAQLIQSASQEIAREDSINAILSCSTSGIRLTRSLLNLSRTQESDQQETGPISPLITQTINLLKAGISKNIDICWKPPLSDDIRVTCDHGRLQQVIMNLIINAKDAMNDRGRITVQLSITALNTVQQSFLGEGNYISLSVADEGHGISNEDKRKIFTPFFTTKPREHGTGLGLSIAYQFAQAAGGHLEVYDNKPVGTIFRIFLPFTRTPL